MTAWDGCVVKIVVHYLRAGVAPCGIAGVPGEWPEGHYWSVSRKDVDCPECLAALAAAAASDGGVIEGANRTTSGDQHHD